MKLNQKLILTIALGSVGILYLLSCSKSKNDLKVEDKASTTQLSQITTSSSYSEEEITNLANSIMLTSNPDLTAFNWNSVEINSETPFIRLWQRRLNCNRLGICEFFPKPIKRPSIEDTEMGRILPVSLSLDNNNKLNNLIFYVRNDLSNYPDESKQFIVDDSLFLNLDTLGFEKIIIPSGIYNYNPNIGIKGGYEVKIIGMMN
jgi:hypothetical protein